MSMNLTERQQDFFREMMNIGVGNAGTALSELLKCKVEIMIPEIHIIQLEDAIAFVNNHDDDISCIKARFFGEMEGNVLLLIKSDQQAFLVNLLEKAASGLSDISRQEVVDWSEWKASILKDFGGVFTSSLLSTVTKFCGLSFSNFTPELHTGKFPVIIEKLKNERDSQDTIILNKSLLSIMETPVEIFIAIVLSRDFAGKLEKAIIQAHEEMR